MKDPPRAIEGRVWWKGVSGEKYKLLSLFSSECEKRNGSTLTSGFRAYVEKDIIYRSVLM